MAVHLQRAFNFGTSIQGLGAAGAGIYGVANRLLIPTGLHHALNSVFWFDVIGINDIGNFQAGQKTIEAAAAATSAADCPGIWANGQCTVEGVVGRYQAGFFPVMMFGLPGAALAMYLRADKSKRKVVGSLMAAGALASFFTGVTEPLEFSFMFVAPLLYVVHALLMGLSVFIASAMGGPPASVSRPVSWTCCSPRRTRWLISGTCCWSWAWASSPCTSSSSTSLSAGSTSRPRAAVRMMR